MLGICYCCQSKVKVDSKKAFGAVDVDHFRNCSTGRTNYVLVFVTSGEYWLMLRCSSNTRMIDIDNVLKDVWLSCCDHLSVIYAEPDSTVYQNLGKTIRHEYDMGDTTYSLINIIGGQVAATNDDQVAATNDDRVAVIEIIGQNIGKHDDINSPRNGQCDYDGSELLRNLTMGNIYRKEIPLQPVYNAKRELYYHHVSDIEWRCKMCDKTYKKPYTTRHLKTVCYKDQTLIGIEIYISIREQHWMVFSVPIDFKIKDVVDKIVESYPDFQMVYCNTTMQTEIKNTGSKRVAARDEKYFMIMTVINIGTENTSVCTDSLVQPTEPLVSHMTTIYPYIVDESGEEWVTDDESL